MLGALLCTMCAVLSNSRLDKLLLRQTAVCGATGILLTIQFPRTLGKVPPQQQLNYCRLMLPKLAAACRTVVCSYGKFLEVSPVDGCVLRLLTIAHRS